jgi:hypothetical protein
MTGKNFQLLLHDYRGSNPGRFFGRNTAFLRPIIAKELLPVGRVHAVVIPAHDLRSNVSAHGVAEFLFELLTELPCLLPEFYRFGYSFRAFDLRIADFIPLKVW